MMTREEVFEALDAGKENAPEFITGNEDEAIACDMQAYCDGAEDIPLEELTKMVSEWRKVRE